MDSEDNQLALARSLAHRGVAQRAVGFGGLGEWDDHDKEMFKLVLSLPGSRNQSRNQSPAAGGPSSRFGRTRLNSTSIAGILDESSPYIRTPDGPSGNCGTLFTSAGLGHVTDMIHSSLRGTSPATETSRKQTSIDNALNEIVNIRLDTSHSMQQIDIRLTGIERAVNRLVHDDNIAENRPKPDIKLYAPATTMCELAALNDLLIDFPEVSFVNILLINHQNTDLSYVLHVLLSQYTINLLIFHMITQCSVSVGRRLQSFREASPVLRPYPRRNVVLY